MNRNEPSGKVKLRQVWFEDPFGEFLSEFQRHKNEMEEKIKLMQADNEKNIQAALENQKKQFEKEAKR